MAKIIKQNTPLVTQPLRTSPATGAILASFGFRGVIPLLHGAQGCSAFAKVFLIGHLREPIPLQNTAIDQVSAVMGGDDNLTEALVTLCKKHGPELITVMTTGLTELQGTDIFRVISQFKRDYPQYQASRIVAMHTPDFVGSMQSGFAFAVNSVIKQLVKEPSLRPKQRMQVNVLCSVGLTAADIDTLKRYLDAFDIEGIFAPDLSISLDGHLGDDDFSPTSIGGTSVLEIEMMSESDATIVIGDSLKPSAVWLEKRFGIAYTEIGMGMSLEDVDELIMTLSALSGKEVPSWITRARQRVQDAMLDSHFVLTHETFSIALEPDLAKGYAQIIAAMGGHIHQVITTSQEPGLEALPCDEVIIGDLAQLDHHADDLRLVISNSHAAVICEPDIPVLRAGYPVSDRFGNMDIRQFGYEGMRERLFAMANIMAVTEKEDVEPHVSAYRFSADQVKQNVGVA
ncbi:nitrogenase iron-molybdenum cofactor biosynthesis protein NifN [Vibrio sp. CAIM 722]|uniref:Nitrogenase iron-molybdenum cofactor biosynthesis protein NifN n=1 Tax=Vibrio eleionomae TaxID=2653505 RepID=A0A7X4RU95_9VIBR|nr:nitrogenase iron-molybdenum cofactor biosynthesis protein NifN [Vibrio eleionomae]MZI93022.1 nitrogenase iron-molybdenum cofactor biosynthesis protein NifN [Vibrio eleionomae]